MKYLKISKNRILINFQYRFNMLAQIFMYIFSFLAILYMWLSIYQNNTDIGAYTKKEMIVYIFIVNMLHYLFDFRNVTRIGELVHSGQLSTYIIRPISIESESLFFYLGENALKNFLMLLIFLGSGIVYKNNNILLTLMLFIIIYFVYFYIEQTLACLGFWMLETWPLIGLVNGIYYILSGTTFPLDILPKPIYSVVKYNPFSMIGFSLTKSLQNSLSVSENVKYIIAGLIWLVIFKMAYNFIMKKGLEKYEGMGA